MPRKNIFVIENFSLPIILLCYRNMNKGGNLKIVSSGFSYHLNNNPHVIKANFSTLL